MVLKVDIDVRSLTQAYYQYDRKPQCPNFIEWIGVCKRDREWLDHTVGEHYCLGSLQEKLHENNRLERKTILWKCVVIQILTDE